MCARANDSRGAPQQTHSFVGAPKLFQMHIALVGPAGAGKRALAQRFALGTFKEASDSSGFMDVYCHTSAPTGATFVHVIGARLSPTVARTITDSCDACVLVHAHALGYAGLEQARALLADLRLRALPILEVATRCDETDDRAPVSVHDERAHGRRCRAGI